MIHKTLYIIMEKFQKLKFLKLLCLGATLVLTLVSAPGGVRGAVTDDQSSSIKESADVSLVPVDYERLKPPTSLQGSAEVRVHTTVLSLGSFDETSMTYTAEIFLAQIWQDDRLNIPSSKIKSGLTDLTWLPMIWKPDTFFRNAKQVSITQSTVRDHYLWIFEDRSIMYMAKFSLTLSCPMDFSRYPHDVLHCNIQIESLSYNTSEMKLVWDDRKPVVINEFTLPSFYLSGYDTGECTQVYSTGNFTCLELNFYLKRNLSYHILYSYLPTCVIVALSWVAFWVDPSYKGTRYLIGIGSIFAVLSVANFTKNLSTVSYMKAIDVFHMISTFYVFAALFENFLVGCFHNEDGNVLPTSIIFRKNSQKEASYEVSEEVDTDKPRRTKGVKLDSFSRLAFPLSFAIFIIIYWLSVE